MNTADGTQYHYTYSPAGDLLSSSRNGVTTTYNYDSAGEVISQHGVLGDITYTHDPDGRLTGRAPSNGPVAHETWTVDGAPNSVTNAQGTTSYTYTPDGNVASQTDASGTTTYKHNSDGELTQVTDAHGVVTTYGYTAHGALSSTARSVSSDVAGGSVPPGIKMQIESCLAHTGCNNPNIRDTISELLAPVPTIDPSALNGVRKMVADYFADTAVPDAGFTFDDSGRVVNVHDGASGASSATGFDARGQFTSFAGAHLTYTPDGDVASYTNAAHTVRFTYNSADQLVTRSVDGVATRYAYDLSGDLVSITLADGTVDSIVWGAGGPVALVTPAGVLYYVLDGRGDVTALTDASGAVVVSYTYAAFGAQTATGDVAVAAVNPLTWDGRDNVLYLPTVQLYQMGVRAYSVVLERFVSADPDVQARSTMLSGAYSFAGNDPVSRVDPSGECVAIDGVCGVMPEPVASSKRVTRIIVAPVPPMAPQQYRAYVTDTARASVIEQAQDAAAVTAATMRTLAAATAAKKLAAVIARETSVENASGLLIAAQQHKLAQEEAHMLVAQRSFSRAARALTAAQAYRRQALRTEIRVNHGTPVVLSPVHLYTYHKPSTLYMVSMTETLMAKGWAQTVRTGAETGASEGSALCGGRGVCIFTGAVIGAFNSGFNPVVSVYNSTAQCTRSVLNHTGSVVRTCSVAAGTDFIALAGAKTVDTNPEASAGDSAADTQAGSAEAGESERVPASCAVHSFPAHTPVHLASGTTTPISRVTPGTRVLSYNTTTHTRTTEPVEAVETRTETKAYTTLTLASGTHLTSTSDHRIYLPVSDLFIPAGSLTPGERIDTTHGIARILFTSRSAPRSAQTYDLTIRSTHTFYAGTHDGILVHNAGPCNDAPSWAKQLFGGSGRMSGPEAREAVTKALNDKYGVGNWKKGAGSEFSQTFKWLTRK